MKRRITSFRTRLLLSFLLCSLIPLMLCSILLVGIIRYRLNLRTQEDLHSQMDGVSHSLDLLREHLDSAAHALAGDRDVVLALDGYAVEPTRINTGLFSATDSLRGCASVTLCDTHGKVLSSTGAPERLPVHWGILHSASQGKTLFQIPMTPTEEVLLQAAAPVTNDQGRILGYLTLQISAGNFTSLFDGDLDSRSGLLILNSFWRPVFASDLELALHSAPLFRSQVLSGSPPGEEGFLYEIRTHSPTGLILLLQMPRTLDRATTAMVYAVSLSCTLFCVLISVLIYLPLSKQITAPVQQLRKAFGRLEQDDLSVRVPEDRTDEFGQLAMVFNHTVKALDQNRQDLLQNQKELNEAQIRLLQTQLNPHFLCNTLDTMKWISKIHKVPEVAELSANLADILRYCITPEEFVPLYREVDFLDRYIRIQKIRMGEKFDFQVDLPEELGTCIVPKMILQPIVENAVLHGLRDTPDSIIRLTVRSIGDLLKITVTDNGCGIPQELAGKPYHRPPHMEGHHLGLYNVDTILSKHYGSGYGLYLDRGPGGVGTSVIATLPMNQGGTEA